MFIIRALEISVIFTKCNTTTKNVKTQQPTLIALRRIKAALVKIALYFTIYFSRFSLILVSCLYRFPSLNQDEHGLPAAIEFFCGIFITTNQSICHDDRMFIHSATSDRVVRISQLSAGQSWGLSVHGHLFIMLPTKVYFFAAVKFIYFMIIYAFPRISRIDRAATTGAAVFVLHHYSCLIDVLYFCSHGGLTYFFR